MSTKLLTSTDVRSSILSSEKGGLVIFEAIKNNIDPIIWTKENRSLIDENLLKYGGVLLRNFKISTTSEFNQYAEVICTQLLDYTFASSPRTLLEGKVYTSTEFRADKEIPFHNEKSYSRDWPATILFFCVIPPEQGGETPVVDSRRVFNGLDKEIIDKFDRHGVLYVRRYNEQTDLSWQHVFQTDHPTEVEAFCREHDIEFAWQSSGSQLTTKQVCQATWTHPITMEKVWFNQAHIFHLSVFEKEMQNELLSKQGEHGLSRNAYYGDGSPIEEEALDHIREVYRKEEILFKWQRGDILILDNVLMAHGRKPYQGDRKIAVAMG